MGNIDNTCFNLKKKIAGLGLIILSSIILVGINAQSQTLPNQINQSNQSENTELVSQLNKKIEAKQERIKQLKKEIDNYNKTIKKYRNQAITLNGQIDILNSRIKRAELDLELIQNQIEEINLEIQKTEADIEKQINLIANQKKMLAQFIYLINKNDRKNYLTLLLTYDSLSDFFNQLSALENIQGKTQQTLDKLQQSKQALDQKEAKLKAQEASLEKLKTNLEERKQTLEEEKLTKQNILSQTRQSEWRFQNLLSKVKHEQAVINFEIKELEQKIREKLQSGGRNKLKELGEVVLNWPVPKNTITAYFHDPDYPFRYIFEHPAIDIRAPQGTPVRAAAAGFVARIRDGGLGYSYVMVVHNQNISTVYGHVSKILVQEDQFVTKGEIIALSGGLPGTLGAGLLSTGPHLHFEVRINGIPVDPLRYLP